MLAAESAWRVLRAEHSWMRQWLSSIGEVLQSHQWKHPGGALVSLRQLVQRFQNFNDSTHRPKGVVLVATLRRRTSEVDELLDRLELTGNHCKRLLTRALALLDAVERGEKCAAAECESVLEKHRSLMQAHMDEEDTELHSHTARLLTPDEWSRIVSSISSVVESTGGRASQ